MCIMAEKSIRRSDLGAALSGIRGSAMTAILNRVSFALLGAAMAPAAFGMPAETVAQPEKPSGSDPKTKPKATAASKDLYGEQGGEKAAPANARLPNTVMRARLEDTFLKLSNPFSCGRHPTRRRLR
jgi:hypothetical protein